MLLVCKSYWYIKLYWHIYVCFSNINWYNVGHIVKLTLREIDFFGRYFQTGMFTKCVIFNALPSGQVVHIGAIDWACSIMSSKTKHIITFMRVNLKAFLKDRLKTRVFSRAAVVSALQQGFFTLQKLTNMSSNKTISL